MTRQPIEVHCAKCKHEWAIGFAPVLMEIMGKLRAACPLCQAKGANVRMGRVPQPTAEGDLKSWVENGDTGVSSLTIFHVLARRVAPDTVDVPHDPADFGRCARLLKVMPSWRVRLHEVAAAYPAWKPLVDAWDELTALYEAELPTGKAPRLYARMRDLLGKRA